MADIRIKDLTTTASSTASDDFFAADGTTNGTRKLSAYSPSFGGNATVGGTLTVSGTSTSSVAGSFGIGTTTPTSYAARVLQINDSSGSTSAGIKLTNNTTGVTNDDGLDITMSGSTGYIIQRENASLIFQTNATTALTLNNSQGATIAGTTASTTTSSGALVVSGGVGVAGSITLGGGVNIAGSASDPLPAGTSGVWTASGSGLRINSAGYTFASLTGTSVSDAKWTLNATTASSSTSTGALVVSGGVGVAGAVYGGSTINIGGALTSVGADFRKDSTSRAGLFVQNRTDGAAASAAIQVGTSDNTLTIEQYPFSFTSSGSKVAQGGRIYGEGDLAIQGQSSLKIYTGTTGSDTLAATFVAGVTTLSGTLVASAASNAFRITTAQTPASATATGTAGTIAWDTSYIYVCTATNTWKRAAISTW